MKQKLHLVFGGELSDLEHSIFSDLENIDLVGLFPNVESARDAWKAASQKNVDNAKVRYFIADLSKLRKD